MSSASLYDTKERIRQAIDIVDLVGSYLPLRREGRAYKALCPWHDDTRPSLQVNPDRQSFKCWVCDVGGDIFSFVMKMENVAFPEALAMLAERAGVELTPHRAAQGAGPGHPPAEDDKAVLYRVMSWAESCFHRCLHETPQAEAARRYLQQRGISPESVVRFRLGYAPDEWDWLLRQGPAAGFSPQLLEACGLAVRKQGGGWYDRFRGRVLFPIRDVQGRPVALGGRILPGPAADQVAKYINSPETPLFSKSRMLYGLDVAREAILRSRTALVMEGYTDCILAHQCGFANAVAVLGTALGQQHVAARGPLRRFADRVVLVLDGDEAGQRRASQVLELFVAEQFDVRILTLPDDLDPCDFLLQHGSQRFQSLIDTAVDALEHAFRTVTAGIDVQHDTHAAHQALEGLLQVIAKAPRLQGATTTEARLRESTILARLARVFHIEEPILRQRLSELRRNKSLRAAWADSTAPSAADAQQPDPWDRELLELILLEPESAPAVAEVVPPEQLRSAACRRIYQRCCELSAAGEEPRFERLLLEFDDPQTKNLLVDFDESGRTKGTGDVAARLRELLAGFQRRRHVEAQRIQAHALKDRQLDPDQQLALLQEMLQRERTRQGISAPTDG